MPSNSNSITLYIRDDGNLTQDRAYVAPETKEAAVTKRQVSLIAAGGNAVRSIFTFATQNYGNLTGDYVTQAKINNGLDVVSKGTMLIAAGLAGGPVGVAAAGVSLAISEILNYASGQIEYRKQQVQSDALARRMGMYEKNGGR